MGHTALLWVLLSPERFLFFIFFPIPLTDRPVMPHVSTQHITQPFCSVACPSAPFLLAASKTEGCFSTTKMVSTGSKRGSPRVSRRQGHPPPAPAFKIAFSNPQPGQAVAVLQLDSRGQTWMMWGREHSLSSPCYY